MGSLRNRIFVFSLVLLLAMAAAVLALVSRATYDHTLGQLSEQLSGGYRVFDNELASRRQAQRRQTEIVARDYGLKDEVAAAGPDAASLRVTLQNFRDRSEASLALAVDVGGRIIASTDTAFGADEPFPFPRLIAVEGSADALVVRGDRLHHLLATPIYAPRPQVIGWLVLGYRIDDASARHLASLTGLSVSLLAGDPGGHRVLASSLEGRERERLGRLTAESGDGQGGIVTDGGEQVLRLSSFDAAGDGPVTVVLQRSLSDALRDYRTLQWQLAAVVLIALSLSTAGAFWVARTVSQPISAMVAYVRRIGEGDYAAAAPTGGDSDVGVLAREFAQMQAGIAERESEIRRLAFHDALTGLPNRNRFQQLLGEAIVGGDRRRFAVLVMDLNDFSDINDTLGHLAGDRLLRQVAERLSATRRPQDAVARLGGDEFAVLLQDVDAGNVMALTQHYGDALGGLFELEGLSLEVNATVGVAVHPDHGESPGVLLQRAEVAMYLGKHRNQSCTLYDSRHDRHSLVRLTLMVELRAAIARDEVMLFVQPKLDLASGSVVGVECLVRWQHPVHGFVPPDEFIPLAEQTGNIRHLTNWVLATALRWTRCWREAGLDLQTAVNISAVDLLDAALPDRIVAALDAEALAPAALTLEITESAVMQDPDKAVALLAQLRARGVRLSIDDYGVGQSSMAQLKRLPVHELKIDKSFVLDLADNADDAIIVHSAIDLGHRMGLTIVAEGVENARSLAILARLGCDTAQGYHIARPMPAAELHAWLERRATTREGVPT